MIDTKKWDDVLRAVKGLNVDFFRAERIVREARYTSLLLEESINYTIDSPADTRLAPNGGRCELNFQYAGFGFTGSAVLSNAEPFDASKLFDIAMTDALSTTKMNRAKRDALDAIQNQFTTFDLQRLELLKLLPQP